MAVIVSTLPESRGKQRAIQLTDTATNDTRITITWDEVEQLARDLNDLVRSVTEETVTKVDVAVQRKEQMVAARTAARANLAEALRLVERDAGLAALERAAKAVRELAVSVTLGQEHGAGGQPGERW